MKSEIICRSSSDLNRLFKFLKLKNIYKLELSKFIHQLYNNKLHKTFYEYFVKVKVIRDIKTRLSKTVKFYGFVLDILLTLNRDQQICKFKSI